MFDYVRNHTKLMMGLLFLLIIPSFVLFGIDGYKRFRDHGAAVASVGSHEITQAEWDAAHRQQVERLRQAMPTLDAQMFDSPQARYATLQRMVQEQVLEQAARDEHLQISDARLARELQANPAIAALRQPDGTLDVERYRQLLGSQGMTPDMYEAGVRQELAVRQVEAGLRQTGFVPPALADLALNAFFQQRQVQLTRFAPADFTAQVNPSDAELQAYYQSHQAQFQAPERARIEYVVLDLEAVKKSISVNEQELKSYYEQNAARLSGTEERRASHILLSAPKDAPAAERAKVKARAEALLAQLRKAPETFAEVARKDSQDPGSAAKGGDLGFFARGAMVKPFEDAAFALKKGEISAVVESDFGYHIIQVTDIKASKTKSFEELRPAIEADLRNQQAQRKFAELADTFTNTVYEQSDSLKPVAERLKLDLHSADGVQRQPAPGATGALANPKFLAAVFSADATEKKRNTEAVEIGPSQLAAAHVLDYAPAHALPLAEVRAQVRARVIAQRAAELARAQGARLLAEWRAHPEQARLGAAQTVARDQAQGLDAQVVEAVLRADATRLPAWVGVDLGDAGYVVARVNQVTPAPAPAPEVLAQRRAQLAQAWGTAEERAYGRLLQRRYKAEIKVPSAAPAGAAP